MSEEIAETVEAEAEVQANEAVEAEPIDVNALADERLEAESQRQLQAFMQDHGLDTPEETTEEDVQETRQEEEKEVAQAEP